MAYIRSVKVKSSSGQVHKYLRIVESVWEDGKVKQKVIANLGNAAVLRKDIRQIVNGLLKACGEKKVEFAEDGNLISVKEYGVGYVAEGIWKQLELDEVLSKQLSNQEVKQSYEKWMRMMVVNKLSDPTSKLGILRWLGRVYWPGHGFPAAMVNEELSEKEYLEQSKRQVMKLYRAMDYMLGYKAVLEKHLYMKLRDLFSLQVDLVFYDLTSSYFEGEGPEGLAKQGYSRDHEPGKNQVVIGVILCNGMPIGHEVFEGNRVDKKTVKEVLGHLKERFHIDRCIFIGDRGLISKENLQQIEDRGFDSILALRKRRNREAKAILLKDKRPIYCIQSKQLGYRQVKTDDAIRYIVCRNPVMAEEQKQLRSLALKELGEKLFQLKQKIKESKKNLSAKTIIRRVEEILSHKHGRRLIDYKIDEKNHTFTHWEKEESLKLEEELDGVYILRSKDQSLTPEQIIDAYKELMEIERAFRIMKSVLDLRPFWHRKQDRVRAHVMICYLAFLIEKFLEQRLKAAGLSLSAVHALESLKHLGAAQIQVDDKLYTYISQLTPRHQAILKAVGLKLERRCLIEKR